MASNTNQLAARLIAERQAEEEAAASTPPPTAEEQAAMFASRSSRDDFASIAGIDYSSSVSRDSNNRDSPVLDDLFSDDDKMETPPVVEATTIDNDSTSISIVEVPESSLSKSARSSLGIEIPDFDTDLAPVASADDAEKSGPSDSLMIQATCITCVLASRLNFLQDVFLVGPPVLHVARFKQYPDEPLKHNHGNSLKMSSWKLQLMDYSGEQSSSEEPCLGHHYASIRMASSPRS